MSENFKIPYGITIDRAVDLMVDEANRTGSEIRVEFNGHMLVARPGMDPKEITEPFWKRSRLNAIQQEVAAIEQRRRAEHIPEMVDALKSAEAWLTWWASHVGNCKGAELCSCGLTAIRHEVRAAIDKAEGK